MNDGPRKAYGAGIVAAGAQRRAPGPGSRTRQAVLTVTGDDAMASMGGWLPRHRWIMLG